MEIVRANGPEIAYERVGEGPPLVFVRGAAEGSRIWRSQFAALADELRSSPETSRGGPLLGCARGFGLADYANCLAALIEALELGPARVGSLGGALDIAEVPVHCHDLRDARPANEARLGALPAVASCVSAAWGRVSRTCSA